MANSIVNSVVSATIQAFGRAKPSDYNADEVIQSILFVWIENGSECKHWATFPIEVTEQLKIGNRATLRKRSGKSGRLRYDIEFEMDHSTGGVASSLPVSLPVSEPGPLSPDQKRMIADWISGQADLYAYCFSQATRVLSVNPDCTPDHVQSAASCLFIAASRKFKLDL